MLPGLNKIIPNALDPATCAAEVLVPRLLARARLRTASGATAVHPTCADLARGWDAALRRALSADGSLVVQPAAAGCCGMAGDRGWSQPGLTAAATAREAAAVRAATPTDAACANPACAQAIGAAAGLAYRHPWVVLAGRLLG
jgi:D-lactate dehydrogenase